MAIVDFAHREIISTLVYFGPPGSGTSTNVSYLYEHLEIEDKSPLHHFAARLETHESRFFDYMPPAGGTIPGFTMRLRVYSLPGDVRNPAHRDEVLRDIDGIVFVADCRRGRSEDNVRYLLELEASMLEQNTKLGSLAMVFQLNHTDALQTISPEKIANDLNPYGFPVCPSSAQSGIGVLETHEVITQEIIRRIQANLAGDKSAIRLNTVHHGNKEKAEDVMRRHVEAIRTTENIASDSESIEEATRARLRRRYAHLKPHTDIDIFYHHPLMERSEPFLLLESRIERGVVHLDVLLNSTSIDHPQRVALKVQQRSSSASIAPPNIEITSSVRTHTRRLPKRIRGTDFPPVAYGLIGLSAGILIGSLGAFLLFG